MSSLDAWYVEESKNSIIFPFQIDFIFYLIKFQLCNGDRFVMAPAVVLQVTKITIVLEVYLGCIENMSTDLRKTDLFRHCMIVRREWVRVSMMNSSNQDHSKRRSKM